MDNIFQEQAKKQFIDFLKYFIEQLSKWFPESEESLNKIEEEIDASETLEKWYKNMNTPLSKKIKYGKALERILSKPAILYHVCEYNDIESLQATSIIEILDKLDIFEKYKSSIIQDDDKNKKIFWKYIHEINNSCWKAFDQQNPYVPTRDEIQKNIKNKKNTEKESPSMNKAFQTSLSSLCKYTKNKDITENKSDEELQTLMTRWSNFSQDSIDNQKITVLCNQKNIEVINKFNQHFEEIQIIENPSEEVWNTIIQLNGYSAVGENIPTKMMGRIENLANKLADDIVNGRANISDMNLQDIGQQVLSQCDESEMNKFASNIENLIPALQSFQKVAM